MSKFQVELTEEELRVVVLCLQGKPIVGQHSDAGAHHTGANRAGTVAQARLLDRLIVQLAGQPQV